MTLNEILKKLITLREEMMEIRTALEQYYDSENLTRTLPELKKMQNLERKIFKKIDDWSK